MANKNYYEILGVKRDASSDDIKKAYRKAAAKWHPDRWVNGTDEEKKIAEEKFKEINEANSVLSDEDKKMRYDQFGTVDGMPNGNDFDPFADFFGGHSGGFADFFGRQNMAKGEDAVAVVQITLKEALNGISKEISYTKQVRCSHCGGTGSEDGKTHTCPKCNGTGRIRTEHRSGFSTIINESVCPECHGSGKKITNKCKRCNGTGLEEIKVTEKIEIPKGSFNGMVFGIPGKGSESKRKNSINGDLIVKVFVIADSRFQINPQNPSEVLQELKLNLYEALVGCEKTVECIDGSKVKVTIPAITRDGKVFNIKGKGMPNVQDNRFVGDMKLIVTYILPKTLTNKQKELLKEFCN